MITEDTPLSTEGSATPAGEPDDDFFSSWDKPSIKRPSNPPSRTGTPTITSRTGSPFLTAGNANGAAGARPKSPLTATANDAENNLPAPTAIRTTSASAIRKTPGAVGGAKRANILGAKKTTKLGAKKVTEAEIDFDAAEKAAKAEAERIERLGYDPEAEEAASVKPKIATAETSIISPTPVNPTNSQNTSSTASQTHQRSTSDVERLGMGMGRLGFGMVGKPAASQATAAAPKKMGFGSVGVKSPAPSEFSPPPYTLHKTIVLTFQPFSAEEEETYARNKFSAQKSISSDEFFGRNAYDPSAQTEAKSRLQGFEGATSISSNAYFGRPEDDLTGLEGGDYGDIETVAKDFVRRMGITAGDDLENLITVAGEGGRKLRGAVARYLNS